MPLFEAPVGPERERNAGVLWPSAWTDSNKFEKHYEVRRGVWAYHTGADLNLKMGEDENAEVYAIGDGVVTFAGIYPDKNVWGGLIIIYHGIVDGKVLYSRYAHVQRISPELLNKNEKVRVVKGQQIARIGGRELGFDPHLHFDISTTSVLHGDYKAAGFWPGENLPLLRNNFTDPLVWLHTHKNMNVESNPASEVKVDKDTGEWLVSHQNGAEIRKDHRLSAEVVQKLKLGSTLILKKAGGGIQDGYLWGQIGSGEFKDYWVAVQKKDKSENYLTKKS